MSDLAGHELIAHLDQFSGDADRDLARLLRDGGFTTEVTIKTPNEGATVRYRLISDPKDQHVTVAQGTELTLSLPYGIYNIWSLRDDKVTSDPTEEYWLTRPKGKLTLREKQ